MGKYMRKSKTTGEVALLEVSQHQSSLGVRTRAKTLALQQLQKSTAVATSSVGSAGSYLQLRSRRLVKPPIHSDSKRQRQIPKESSVVRSPSPSPSPSSSSNLKACSGLRVGYVNSVGGTDSLKEEVGKVVSKEEEEIPEREKVLNKEEEKIPEREKVIDKKEEEIVEREKVLDKVEEEIQGANKNESVELAIEASFGENVMEIEGRERSARETTPCSLIRDPGTIRTPGCTTRRSPCSDDADGRVQNLVQRTSPMTHEMEGFFSRAEGQQLKRFIDKYNFDPVNEKPLPGRYEWMKVDP